jgi:hypothetical protein
MGDAALHLALDIAGVDGAADILHRRVADHARDAPLPAVQRQKKRRVFAISQKHLRTLHPARRLGTRP